ncbi:MAG: acetate/propionate family kinase, partial [Chlorobiaceae bacterium]|nr:acetate/propionate family kinase [Chlorobiaceae bacterium]
MKRILALNTGSSSLKFSLYLAGEGEKLLYTGSLDCIGRDGGRFFLTSGGGNHLFDER